MKQQTQSKKLLARYRSVIISIVIFILIIITILGINIYSTNLINRDTAAVNAVSSLLDTVQGINKNLFDLRLSEGEDPLSPHMDHANKTLAANSAYVDESLRSFMQGGDLEVRDELLTISPIRSPEGVQAIKTILPEWLAFKKDISDYVAVASDLDTTTTLLDLAVNKAQSSGVIIYNQVNKLADDISRQAKQRAHQLQLIQVVGITIAILYFFIFLFFFIRRLRKADLQADAAKEATDNIMRTVNEGLFLVDEDLTVSHEYSAQLENIINQKNLGGKQLIDMLKPMTSTKKLETLKKFIRQLFNDKVSEKLIQDLNPLRTVEIEVLVDEAAMRYETRYLTFNFSRVYRGDEIVNVLSSVSDITRSVKLEERLEKEREQNSQQVALLANVLHTDSDTMSSFIRHAKQVTNNINEVLKRPKSGERDLKQKAQDMFREIHGLKGEASALNLEDFVELCSHFEDKISTMQQKLNLTGNDFLTLTVDLEDLINTTNRVGSIFDRLSGKNNLSMDELTSGATASLSTSAPATQTNASLSNHFTQYAEQVAKRNGKQVSFKAVGLDELKPDSMEKLDTLRETITQMIRNAIVHGIETPDVRQLHQKKSTGIVRVQLTQPTPGVLQLTIDDDGNGLNLEKIRGKALEQGICTKEQLAQLSKQQLHQLIFHSGLSTADSVGEDAGRGVGMDVIKERVKQLHGKIGILSEPGKFTRFVIQFPNT